MLVVGSAMGLGEILCQQFEFGNLPAKYLTLKELDWKNQQLANQQLESLSPTIVVNFLPLDILDSTLAESASILQVNEYLIKACESSSVIVLQLSSTVVFTDGDKKAYDETDAPNTQDEFGKLVLQCEEVLQKRIEKHLLLRFSWLIDAQGDNVFTRALQELNQTQSLQVNPNVKGAPLWVDDALRVLLSLVRQLLSGSENWGVFHYGSADPCSEKEFGQQLIDTLKELQPEQNYRLNLIDADGQQKSSAVLKCRRIRNNFGIHGRTWRQGLKYRIQYWLEGRWLIADSEANENGKNNQPADDYLNKTSSASIVGTDIS